MSKIEREIIFRNMPLLSPFGEFKLKTIEPVARINTVKGKVIGLLDANKPYGDVVMGIIKGYLAQQGAKSFISEVKPVVTRSAGDDIIEKMTKADAVVLSFADCGSCSTGLAMDQATLEKKGVPTVAVVTNHFAGHYARITENMGVPHAPAVIVQHPIGDGATKEMAEEKAKKIVKDVEEALTLPVHDLKENYSVHKWIELRAEL